MFMITYDELVESIDFMFPFLDAFECDSLINDIRDTDVLTSSQKAPLLDKLIKKRAIIDNKEFDVLSTFNTIMEF